MPRPRNPLSYRNRNAKFTGAEVARIVEKLAASKRAKVVRERGDFDLRELESILKPPMRGAGGGSWSIEEIVAARNQQMAGRFRMAARLAESMGADDALFVARQNRLAPVQALGVEIIPSKSGRGDKIADEAEALFGVNGIAISSETMKTVRANLVDHGVAFAAVSEWTPRADGSRVDPVVNAWPIEHVWWHEIAGCYVTPVRRLDCDPDPTPGAMFGGLGSTQMIEPILHGNGRWIVFAKSELYPHRLDAAVLPAGMVWARHAFANRDWAKGSSSHGNAKVVGELPADTALTDAEGNLTQEAVKFLALVQAVASQDSPAGIRPAGSKIDYVTNSSRAWEVWKELSENAERAAARIYLGTDGTLGAQGGAPGVDLQALLGVATSAIQGDLACIEQRLQSGLVCPWTAINFGDDKLAPTRHYTYPDPDEAAVRKDFADRNAAFLAAIKAAQDARFVITPDYVAALADKYGVPVPTLGSAPAA